jgi:hypothetical protein
MTKISPSQLPDVPGGLRRERRTPSGDWCGGEKLPDPGWCGDVRPPADPCGTLPPPVPDWRRALVSALIRRAVR